MHIAVVGAGIAGASAARQLVERNHHVTLFEQFPFGHSQGSSHGKSRIVRRAYSDPFYTGLMTKAYPMWHELEAACRQRLVHEVGLLYFGAAESEGVRTVRSGLVEHEIEHTVYDSSTVRNVLPQLKLAANEIGIFTPGAGWVAADQALNATISLAEKAGCRIEHRKATKGDLKHFEKVIVCAGPWIRDWWPGAPVETNLQTYGYVTMEIEGPVWIEDDGRNYMYGFPGTEATGSKIGVHRPGPEIDPSDIPRTPSEESLALLSEIAYRRFGASREVFIAESAGCIYTRTANDDFLFRKLDDKTWLSSACSGHGFKFGPWTGKVLADFVEGTDDIRNYPRFSE